MNKIFQSNRITLKRNNRAPFLLSTKWFTLYARQCSKLSLLFFGVFWFFLVPAALSTDFTRFLTENSWKVGIQYGVGTDKWGNPIIWSENKPLERNLRVVLSILATAIGLPHLPQYPAFLPVSKDSTEVRPVIVSPVLKSKPLGNKRLNQQQLIDYAGHLLLDYLLGTESTYVLALEGAEGIERVLPVGKTLLDFSESVQTGNVFSEVLSRIPESQWPKMKPLDWRNFGWAIETYIKRLQGIDRKEIVNLLRPVVGAVPKDALKNSRFNPGRFSVRVANLHQDLGGFLKDKVSAPIDFVGSPGRPFVLPPPLSISYSFIPKPHIRLPVIELAENQILTEPEDILWSAFWAVDSLSAERIFAKAQKGKTPSEKLSWLLSQTAKRPHHTYEVTPKLAPVIQNKNLDEPGQFFLHPANPNTLVVVPLNDDEGNEIARVAQMSGASVLALSKETHPHGSRLDKALVGRILSWIRWNEFERVILCELPGETPDMEQALQEKVKELHLVDHHNYSDLKRHASLSSLEQVANLLGYDLSGHSKLIAVMDRSFIIGLLDMGIPKSMLSHWVDLGIMPSLSREAANTAFGKVFVLYSRDREVYQKQMGFVVREYPKIANVFTFYDDSVKFSGSPELLRILEKIGGLYAGKVEAHFSGGDPLRSMFWGLRGIPKELYPEILQKIGLVVEKNRIPGSPALISFGGIPVKPINLWIGTLPRQTFSELDKLKHYRREMLGSFTDCGKGWSFFD